MFGKVLLAACLCFASIGAAFAVNVNTADASELQGIKGLGASKSQAIVDERDANGPFANSDDLADRIKGLGTKSVARLEEAGLTITPVATASKATGKAGANANKAAKPAAKSSARPAARSGTPTVKS
jgi:competence protein ComEA